MKDVRLFLNTLERSLDLMRSGGIDAALRREETDEAVVLTVRIPKRPRGR
jgi:ParB family chromosome partitioning protein